MTYLPLPSSVTIKKSPIHGLGLFATCDIPFGINLGECHLLHQDQLIRTPLGGHINHNNTPNCARFKQGDFYYLKTIRAVKEGEELTLFYTAYSI